MSDIVTDQNCQNTYVAIFVSDIVCIADGPAPEDKSNDTVTIVLAVCLSLVTVLVVVLTGYIFWKRKATQAKATSNPYEVPLRNIQVDVSFGTYLFALLLSRYPHD